MWQAAVVLSVFLNVNLFIFFFFGFWLLVWQNKHFKDDRWVLGNYTGHLLTKRLFEKIVERLMDIPVHRKAKLITTNTSHPLHLEFDLPLSRRRFNNHTKIKSNYSQNPKPELWSQYCLSVTLFPFCYLSLWETQSKNAVSEINTSQAAAGDQAIHYK